MGCRQVFPNCSMDLRILVVDDEADSRELVNAILTRCGSEVRCCESADEAMKTFRDWKPDLLVSDIGMPNEDGYDLIKKLRKQRLKLAREIPAIALTAYATDDDRARTLSAGFQMHLAKPIEPKALGAFDRRRRRPEGLTVRRPFTGTAGVSPAPLRSRQFR